jgi:hypothetical protein
MLCKQVFLALSLAGVCTCAARADTIGTFELSSTFWSGATATGTTTIDETLGIVTAADITYVLDGKSYVYATITDQYDTGTDENVNIFGPPGYFFLSTPGTWVGYTGGDICTTAAENCPVVSFPDVYYYTSVSFDNDGAATGELTLVSTTGVTPEPSSVALLGTGLLAGCGVIRRRLTA